MAFTNKRIAPTIEKVLRSAIAERELPRQEQGLDVDVDSLYVKSAVANEGPRMKRIRPAPMGRAFRYQRRLSHIEIRWLRKQAVAAASETNGDDSRRRSPAKKTAAKKAPAKKAAAKKTAAKKAAKK